MEPEVCRHEDTESFFGPGYYNGSGVYWCKDCGAIRNFDDVEWKQPRRAAPTVADSAGEHQS